MAWIGYMAANGIGKRPEKARLALGITAAASICALAAAYLGWSAAGAG